MTTIQSIDLGQKPNLARRTRTTSFVNVVLFAAFVLGAIFAYRSGIEAAQLQREYRGLMERFGDLEISEPDTIYLRAIPGDGLWSYAWRVYLPKSLDGNVSYALGTSSSGDSGFSGVERDFISRVSMYPLAQSNNVGLYFRFAQGATFTSFASIEFLEFLEANQDKLIIEQQAINQTVKIKSAESKTLLRIAMPDELAEQARRMFPDENHKPLIPIVAEFVINVH